MFVQDYLGFTNSIQIWWVWNILKNNGLCINPVNSHVNNIGFDGSGTHYRDNVKKSISTNIKKKNLKTLRSGVIVFDKKINKSLSDFFKISHRQSMFYKFFPMIIIIIFYKFKTKFTNFLKIN